MNAISDSITTLEPTKVARSLPAGAVLDALRRHINGWYRDAYGDTEPHRTMIEFYATGAPQRIDMLLGPFRRQLFEAPPARVIDVGCGYGHIPLYLAYLWPDTEVVAIDVSDNYYKCAAAAADDLGIDNIRFESRSVEVLDEREAYQLVLCCNMLNFMASWPRLEAALRRLAAAVVPGGHLSIHTPHFWNLREPFSGIPFLHFLPRVTQDRIVRRLGKRSTLLDVRNPSVAEMKRTLLSCDMRLLGVSPGWAIHRFRGTHVTLWFQKC